MNLKDFLINFNNLTLEGICKIKNKDLDALENIMDERQRVIENIENIHYTKEEFLSLCEEIKLVENNRVLQELLEEKRGYIRKEIEELNANRRANQGYNQRFYSKSTVFTKKI